MAPFNKIVGTGPSVWPILIKYIIELFSKNQNLININSHIPKNEGMIKSLEKDEIEKRKKHEEN